MRKKAPWRKIKKKPQEFLCSYDWTNCTFNFSGGAEVTTSNRFLLFSEEDHWNNLDPSTDQIDPTEVILPYNSDKLLYTKKIFDNLNNDCNYYVYEKNKNFCSGYFPSFITLDDNKYNLISQNTNLDNIKDNCYLKTKDNMYLKQIVNKNSRYNLEYLNNLRNACQDIFNIDNQLDNINYTSNSNDSVNKIKYTFNDSSNKIVTPKITYLS